jgi:hypothetical protein
MAASSCADALISGWVSSFGVPAIITSDRGSQFTSSIWDTLCSKLGVKHSTTTAYHPHSNGLVERAHRQLKEALKSRLAGATWLDHLPWVLLGLRAAPKDDSNISSAELVYGVPLVLPGVFVDAKEPPATDFLEHMRATPTSIPMRPLPPRPGRFHSELLQASWVYIRRGGTTPPGEKTFLIKLGNNSVDAKAPLGQGAYSAGSSRPLRAAKDQAGHRRCPAISHVRRSHHWGGPLWRSCIVIVIRKILQIYC